METSSPDISYGRTERFRFVHHQTSFRICAEIEGHDIVASNYQGLDKLPDTDGNRERKEILRAALEETLRKKADLVSELHSLPPCTTFNCTCKPKVSRTPSPMIEEPEIKDSNQEITNSNEIPPTTTLTKNKREIKKRKIKKDTVEDFFPLEKLGLSLYTPSEPITIITIVSQILNQNAKGQEIQRKKLIQ
ncbi:hypothetical protein TNIN_203421 [Trichonephila inaurata madagascariensis]|uniref:Uncharacterized protein n=1 Tax=Trichonephila inaurata madagascariensis TaxID=2747483 RepID=A0A8X7CJG4_9ARAC|nr:hypothetical protein TNIN_203421 [Trichonephila inaurata madagascariensis]